MTGVQTCALPICRILERGTHDELMALGGEYQQIHASQSRTGREEEVA